MKTQHAKDIECNKGGPKEKFIPLSDYIKRLEILQTNNVMLVHLPGSMSSNRS